jgi:hypothetical protein
MQYNVDFGYQLSICSGTKEKPRKTLIEWPGSCQSHVTTDGQSVSQYVVVSSSHSNLWTDIIFCLKVAVLSLWGTLSDERLSLSPVSHFHQCLVHYQKFNIIYIVVEVEVEVNLRPTVSRPVRLGIGPPFGTLDQILSCSSFFCWHLIILPKASSLTRRRVCSLQWNHSLAPITILYCLIWDCVPFLSPLTTRRDYGGSILTRNCSQVPVFIYPGKRVLGGKNRKHRLPSCCVLLPSFTKVTCWRFVSAQKRLPSCLAATVHTSSTTALYALPYNCVTL